MSNIEIEETFDVLDCPYCLYSEVITSDDGNRNQTCCECDMPIMIDGVKQF